MSGGSDKAAKKAQAQQDAQQAQIQSATSQINSIFDDPTRTNQYSKLAADTTSYYTNQLNQQKTQNDLAMKFALARNGQTGGSVQADQAAQAGKDYTQGLLQASQQGQQAGASLRSQDQQSRANLIALAQNGLSTTDAATDAASALKSNLSSAQANNTTNALGNVFGDFANLYTQSQNAAAARQGQLYAYQTMYTPGFGSTSGSSSYGG